MNSKIQSGYPSIDKPWQKYFPDEILNKELPQSTLYEYVYNKNKEHLQDVALIYYGRKITYKELFDNVDICTCTLANIGIKANDCITLCVAGVPEAIYLVLACSRLGALANFLNPLFEKEQFVERINETNAEYIFVLDVVYSKIEEALPKTNINRIIIIPATNSIPNFLSKIMYFNSEARKILKNNKTSQRYLLWNDFIKEYKDYTGEIYYNNEFEKPVIMVYSSGTTGASKGIVLTNYAITATLDDSISYGLPLERGYKFLQMIPVWFSTGIAQSVFLPLSCGVTVVLEPVFSAEAFVKDLSKYRPTMTIVATSIWMSAIKSKSYKKIDLSELKYPFTGGEKMIPSSEAELNKALLAAGCTSPVIKGYGMCELGGKVTDSYLVNKTGSVGVPMAHIIVGIFDPITNKELKYGNHGEIRVNSPSHMKEYYKNREATDKYFWSDASGSIWGCTGDIGYIDEDGLLFVLGRVTDSCVLDNGKKIYLFDIEEEVIKDEAVNQCKVVYTGIGDRNTLICHIVLKDGIENTDDILKRIHSRIREDLPDYMVPQYYKFRKSMPVHANGKRDVESLKEDRDELVCIK